MHRTGWRRGGVPIFPILLIAAAAVAWFLFRRIRAIRAQKDSARDSGFGQNGDNPMDNDG